MKKFLLALFLSSNLLAQTVVTNIVYITNTVVVQAQPTVYPGQTVIQPVVIQQAPTVVYQPAPVYVGPPVIIAPFGFPHYRPHYYYGPSIHFGVGFGGYRRW
jgi:hypothetical protein